MYIFEITDPQFAKYGRIISEIDFSALVQAMRNTPLPEGITYIPSDVTLEGLQVASEISHIVYGEMPVQVGYCNGHNVMLNALEYHRTSEINIAATEAVLMLGCQQDMSDTYTYETQHIEAFRVPEGTAVELYATTLHYAPCGVQGKGFQVAIVLPRGTNYPLMYKHAGGEDALLAATNKWLVGHESGELPEGTFIGLIGKNLNLNEDD